MDPSISLENQLLATKFYVPVTSGSLIPRPRLIGLLNKSLEYPLTLVSASAGFGKTTLLAAWSQSLLASHRQVAWISLEEEDNEPRRFWMYVLTALEMQQPERFKALLMQLQSPQVSSFEHVLTTFINLLAVETDDFVLILDDYQVITEQHVHATLTYLIEHLPAQLRIIVVTRADPPLPLSLLRARGQVLEVRTDQLRCTVEETRAFFHEVIGIQLPNETLQQITHRMEGWLVGLRLLGLSLPEWVDPLNLPQEIRGDQRYILDYLTEVVLQQQPQDVQTFLLCTSILDRLNASLCDAVLGQHKSQQILEWLAQSNLFIVSLDSRRLWYRYHVLFAEALRYRLEQTQADSMLALHYRASLWYAQHDQTTQAILHAIRAKEWQWATDLIERRSLRVMSLTCGTSEYKLRILQRLLDQLPAEVLYLRPRLCLTCVQLLWEIAPYIKLLTWLDSSQATLTALLRTQIPEGASPKVPISQGRQEQENLLGEVIAWHAVLLSIEDGQAASTFCQQALSLLSAENAIVRSHVGYAQLMISYTSAVNNAATAIEEGLRTSTLAQKAGYTAMAIALMGVTACLMIGAGRLDEALCLAEQAIRLGTNHEGLILPETGWPMLFKAEILREHDKLDVARSLVEEGISLCRQIESISSLGYLACGYAVLLRIYLSQKKLDAACSALQEFERISMSMNQPVSSHHYSYFTTIDQVRLWLTCEELDRALCWAEGLNLNEQHRTPFAHERKDVAHTRIFLATAQPNLVLQQLEPVLQRAISGQRWGHVIEIRILQALAYQMQREETQALSSLSDAVRLAEPRGYIRSFVDEGPAIEFLLYHLRKRDCKQGLTPYLDTLLAAFQQENIAYIRAEERAQVQALPEPLSKRELEVLQLLARGASNQEIAQELVIAIDTVKRHVSHIFSKLGVNNRVQAVRQTQTLGLLDEKA